MTIYSFQVADTTTHTDLGRAPFPLWHCETQHTPEGEFQVFKADVRNVRRITEHWPDARRIARVSSFVETSPVKPKGLVRVKFRAAKQDLGPAIQPTVYPASCSGVGNTDPYNQWTAVVQAVDDVFTLWPTAYAVEVITRVTSP